MTDFDREKLELVTRERDGLRAEIARLRHLRQLLDGPRSNKPCDECSDPEESGVFDVLAHAVWCENGHTALCAEVVHLRELINTPHTADFLEAVRIEAAHQRDRWGDEHDAGKAPTDWIWLLGHLAGKVVHALAEGDQNRALHHTISSAAMLLNWHAHIAGVRSDFRPGIDPGVMVVDGERVVEYELGTNLDPNKPEETKC